MGDQIITDDMTRRMAALNGDDDYDGNEAGGS
jgi:hypothetical protein